MPSFSFYIWLTIMLAILYIAFPRWFNNIIIALLKRKDYVVCHLKRANTGFIEKFNIIPKPDYLTKVRKFSYDLNPKYKAFAFKGRSHFLLDENNSKPRKPQNNEELIKVLLGINTKIKFESETNEDIIFVAAEIQAALDNDAYHYLFTKKKEILMIGLFILIIIDLALVYYNIILINRVGAYLDLFSKIDWSKVGSSIAGGG